MSVNRKGLVGRRDQRGQALVEFALVLPILLMLLFGIVEFGRILNATLIVTNGAREGARYAAVGYTFNDVEERVKSVCPLNPDSITVSVSYPNGQIRGQPVEVAVSYPVDLVTPLLGDILGGTYTVESQAAMRLE